MIILTPDFIFGRFQTSIYKKLVTYIFFFNDFRIKVLDFYESYLPGYEEIQFEHVPITVRTIASAI